MAIDYEKRIEVRDMRNGDWYWVHKSVLEHRQLSSSEKLVYHALAYFANNKTQSSYPSMTKIANLVDIHRVTVVRSVKKLSEVGLIKKEVMRGKYSIYTLLKVSGNNKLPVTNKNRTGSVGLQPPVTNKNSNNNKYNNTQLTKDASPNGDAGIDGKEINEVLEGFMPVNPSIGRLYANKSQRAALGRLICQHGREKMTWVIKSLGISNKSPYAPTVTTPIQLEYRFGDLASYWQKQKSKSQSKGKEIVGLKS